MHTPIAFGGRGRPGGCRPVPSGRRVSRAGAGSPGDLPPAASLLPDLLPRLRLQAGVLLHCQVPELALELLPAVIPLALETAVLERRSHSAVRLLVVRAIGEATASRRFCDVVEGLRKPFL